MTSFVQWLAQRRKALVPAVLGVLPVAAHYLGVGPAAGLASGVIWYGFIVAELTAAGVYAVANDPVPPVVGK